MKKEIKSGFTLIELLIVVLIVGILASAALPQYTRAVEKARAAEAKQVLADIFNAKKMYELSMRGEPSTFADLDVKFFGGDGNLATGASFSSKNFTYTLSSGSEVCPDSRYVKAVSASRPNGYTLSFCGDGFTCADSGGKITCKNIGL